MLISKRRMIHALTYEIILLVIIAIALSFIFAMPMQVTGTLGIAMAVTSVIWNMTFNHFFEKFEAKRKLKRTVGVRILHAIGFEGGLMLATIPMVAYALEMPIWQAILTDLSMTLCILVYTFIFQWCYDHAEAKLGLGPLAQYSNTEIKTIH
ncbi:AceI family chlorhexidine efflux PACE transporter [Acinetobacter sp. SM34]|uniref:AceI family chlorhexidine efflux PACE transporter n=1 Tax=Acinetobacter sp. SM34 TaxID=1301620 RepID=UPI001EDBA8B8|nr:AceI family chlorhexidine efflux PACE transporter [Acinetobacter sp. SM34]MCG2608283.1 AceI family chlorhexidine efflux PACE transporter [Acinetobacter sp. SM34]